MKSLKEMEDGVEELASIILTILLIVLGICGILLVLRLIIGLLIAISMGG